MGMGYADGLVLFPDGQGGMEQVQSGCLSVRRSDARSFYLDCQKVVLPSCEAESDAGEVRDSGRIPEIQILQAIEIDYIDESEVLSPADNVYHIDKTQFDVPFVCGAKNLGEALRRIAEGATMIRTKGEPGTGDVVQAVTHMRMMQSEIRRLVSMSEDELYEAAKQLQAPYDLVKYVHENGKLPVVNFAAGGVATPADAALMMQLGAEGVFVGSGIFKSGNPAKRAQAIVKAVTNYNDPKMLAELSEDLGEAMVGINEQEIALLMAERGK